MMELGKFQFSGTNESLAVLNQYSNVNAIFTNKVSLNSVWEWIMNIQIAYLSVGYNMQSLLFNFNDANINSKKTIN